MRHWIVAGAVWLTFMAAPSAALAHGRGHGDGPRPVRFATFNASLNRSAAGVLEAQLASALAGGAVDPQLAAVLDIIAINDPDVLLVNEFDTGVDGGLEDVTAMFAELTGYEYFYSAPSNTGIPSGFDLNENGVVGGADDAFGFGFFPGQFGLAVFSRFPIETDDIRTFQTFLWKDMPGALLPENADGSSYYSPEELAVFRLSSKSHWDVPIDVGGPRPVHFLVSHPTPPVFDGPEDRNGTRNHDEIRFWADYVTPRRAWYIVDDEPAAQLLLDHPRVNTRTTPASAGAVEATALQGGANATHLGEPRFDTADFADTAPGNLRADYVLPSTDLRIVGAAVFWPVQGAPGSELTGVFPFPSSDHRLVYVDLDVPGRRHDRDCDDRDRRGRSQRARGHHGGRDDRNRGRR